MLKKFFLITLISGILFMNSCDSSSDNGPNIPDQPLYGTLWVLEKFDMANGNDVDIDNQNYTILINSDGTTTLKADCNDCTGVASIDVNQRTITFSDDFSCTNVQCPSGGYGQTYAASLELATKYEIKSNKLTIYFGNQNNKLIFETEVDED